MNLYTVCGCGWDGSGGCVDLFEYCIPVYEYYEYLYVHDIHDMNGEVMTN